MAYDEHLADRIRQTSHEQHVAVEEKKMMGGLCFMVNDKGWHKTGHIGR